ncbi:MAG: carboxypeptidase-like regulatory domain-containing protein, partial [Bacteroidales bacterium]
MKKIALLTVFTVLMGVQCIFAQKQITGKISSSADGTTLPGVTVSVKGTTTATYSDVNGKYSITVPASATTLVFSFIGMKTQEVEIGNLSSIDVKLESSATQLGGVVVTALGIKKDEKALGYSVQQVKGDIIEQGNNTNVINDLGGKVAGVQVTSGSGAAGGSSFITIRGNNSILGDNQPLFVVDGVPIDNSQYNSGNPDNGAENNLTTGVAYSNRAIDINPDDIASVSVLKGGAATALYGLRAANGVVLITTKKGAPSSNGNKVNVTFGSTVSLDKVNKLPDLQNTYAQGDGGVWLGPETHCSTSWGPALSTLNYANPGYFTNAATQDPYGLGYYDWDKNGILVSSSDPNSSHKTITPY